MATLTLELEVKLTREELQAKANAMATAVLSYDKYEAEKKEIAKDLGDKMKDLHAEMSVLARVIDNKTEPRAVECRVELDMPEKGTKTIWRNDTGEIVKQCPMAPEDRQMPLIPTEEKVVVN